MAEWESLTLVWTKEYVLVTKRKAYKCYNLRLNKVVERINVTIDETGIPESKKEENQSMEQIFEEEDEKEEEEEDEDEDEENSTEVEEQVQHVSQKTHSKRVQKNHPSYQIIGNKDAGVETKKNDAGASTPRQASQRVDKEKTAG
jgi:hypothetical protein